jgi:HlyD family secretion protein
MKKSNSTKWVIGGVVVLLLALFGLSKSGAFGKDEGIKVTAEKVQRKDITELVNATGKVYPEVEVKVSPDISGVVTELFIKEGDSVRRGQVLARIDADIYNIQKNQAASGVAQSQAQVDISQAQVSNSQAALEALNAQRDQAQRTFERQKQLFDEKVISRSEFDIAESNLRTSVANYNAAVQGIRGGVANIKSAQASVKTARASLDRAAKDLRRTVIVAPRDGVVSLLNVKKGESVAGNSFNVGTEILRIADMEKIEVRVDVGENDIPKVKLGDSAIVEVDAYNTRKFKGIVTQIASSNNGAAGVNSLASASSDVTQYKVYIRLLPQSYLDLIGKGTFPFRPGMSASADIQTKTHRNVLSIPINAVTTRMKGDSAKASKGDNYTEKDLLIDEEPEVVVFALTKEGKAKKIVVKTDIQDINNIEVTEGLKEDDEIIVGPYEVVSKTLKNDSKVKKVSKSEVFEKKE